MRTVVRGNDVVARIGGDEFSVLGVECNRDDAEALVRRLCDCFQTAGIRASIGHANRHPDRDLQAAVEEADANMYAEKRRRRLTVVK
jgi:diguanylate cyclase (GGDEF)-like protein